MAAVEMTNVPRKVVWPRKIEQQDEPKAIPPWAEQDAKPPPPPVTHYTPYTPITNKSQGKQHYQRAVDDSYCNDLFMNKQSNISKSKSESQLNNFGTMYSLKSASASFNKNRDAYKNKSTSKTLMNQTKTKESYKSTESLLSSNRKVINQTSTATYSRSAALNKGVQITAEGVVGAVRGQVAKKWPNSHGEDKTSTGSQSSTKLQTEQQSKQECTSTTAATLNEIVSSMVKSAEVSDTTVTKDAMEVKNVVGGTIAGAKPSVAVGAMAADQAMPWRKGDVSAKAAAHMPPSPRLENRKIISAPVSSPPTVQPVIKEQKEELPDAPWRKSPQLPRKTVSTTANTVSQASKITSNTQNTVKQMSSKSSCIQKEVSKSSFESKIEIDNKNTFVAAAVVSVSTDLPLPASALTLNLNSVNLPPHVPVPQKKLASPPKSSPKGSPVLPRRGAQITPPPTPPTSIKPVITSVSISDTTIKSSVISSVSEQKVIVSTVSDALNISKPVISPSSAEKNSSPIVLRNTVIPISNNEIKENNKLSNKDSTPVPDPPSRSTSLVSTPQAISDTMTSTIEKTLIENESVQCSSLSSKSEVVILPPPPPSVVTVEHEINYPHLPPPPSTTLTETHQEIKVSSLPFNIIPTHSDNDKESYIPIPIMSRIKSFEDHSSQETDYHAEKSEIQQAKPVGPWVKRTSSGIVNPQEGWKLSPVNESCPITPQMQQQPTEMQASTQQQRRPPPTITAAISEPSQQQQYEEQPQLSVSPHKPHQYTPQQYMSPTQLTRQHQQQSQHQRVPHSPTPQKKPVAQRQQVYQQQQKQQHQEQQQPELQQHQEHQQRQLKQPNQNPISSIPAHLLQVEPRLRSGSTSEELNHSYCLAHLASGLPPTPSDALAQPADHHDADPLFDPWCDPKNPRVIQFQDVSAAAFKIKSGIMNTPCTRSHMSTLTGMEIFFKKEFNQYTGSFKERGARYTLLSLTDEQRSKGVIAASAGNHALALSFHGQDLGIPVTVVMPLVAPIMKVQSCRQYGANILVRGNDIAECRTIALRMAKDQGQLYINGYDHPHILAGQGTMGLEIVEQVQDIDAVVIPVGGGGLIAGVALAVKALYPNIQVIGVESEKCASFGAALKHGSPIYTKAESTLADGLAVPTVGINAFATAATLIDKMVVVREEWIAIAILRLVELEKAVVEGAGATALAAILAGLLPELKGKRVVIPLCGGNIDTTVLGRCLERGLAADGRLVKFTVTVSDRPGGIAELTRLMASLGVSIKDMTHERAWIRSDIFSVEVKVMCEVRDYEHFTELSAALRDRYKILRFAKSHQVHDE